MVSTWSVPCRSCKMASMGALTKRSGGTTKLCSPLVPLLGIGLSTMAYNSAPVPGQRRCSQTQYGASMTLDSPKMCRSADSMLARFLERVSMTLMPCHLPGSCRLEATALHWKLVMQCDASDGLSRSASRCGQYNSDFQVTGILPTLSHRPARR